MWWWNGVKRESEAGGGEGVTGGQWGSSWRGTKGANLERSKVLVNT